MGQSEKPRAAQRKNIFQKRAEFMNSVEKAALDEVRKYKESLPAGQKMTLEEARNIFQALLMKTDFAIDDQHLPDIKRQ
jgi:hypothetical protein